MDLVSLICTFPPPNSMRPFGSSLASDNPMMGDPLESSHVSSQKQNREGIVGAQSRQYRVTVVEQARDVVDPGPRSLYVHYHLQLARDFLGAHYSRKSNPMMGDPLGSSHVSSQKQNCEGVVEAQSE
ncbi:unnamed protein product [Malus baccata var. baccata]